jgi:ribosome-binding factor A
MSHRLEKVESTLARAIQQVISQGLHDPRAGGLISVLRVDVSPDMANAMVFVSIFPEDRSELTMHALRHAAKHIRHEAAELVDIRRMPHIEFRLDTSLKRQAEIFDALAKARASTPLDTAGNPESSHASGESPANDPSAPSPPDAAGEAPEASRP